MIEAAIETPTYDLTVFKLHFGRLTGKAYTKGERVLRFDAIARNTAELRCGKMIDKFAEIVTRLAGIAERFATALDCVDTGFIRDAILDGLPTGVRLGATRIGVSPSTNPGCATRCVARALAPAPNGFTVAEFTAKVHARTGHDHIGYSLRQATYGLRKLRGKRLDKPGRTRRYHVPPLAHHRRPAHPARPAHRPDPRRGAQPRIGHKPAHWARVDRDYERIRLDMQTLFNDLAIETQLAA